MEITITTQGLHRSYEVAIWQEAVQMFFDDVRAGNIALGDLGTIGEWTDGKDHHPFRIASALFRCGLLSREELDTIHENAGLDLAPAEVAAMVNEDSWMVRRVANNEESNTVQ